MANNADKKNEFSDAQAFSGVGTFDSTNIINLSQARNLGVGEPMVIRVNIKVAADIGDADETYNFVGVSASDLAFTTPVEFSRRNFSIAQAATLLAGKQVVLALPPELDLVLQYLKLQLELAGTTPAITLSAHLVPQSFVGVDPKYANGFEIKG